MLRIAIVFIFLINSLLCWSTDSLQIKKALLHQIEDKDQKIKTLQEIIPEYSGQGKLDRDSLRKYANQLLDLIEDQSPSELTSWTRAKLLVANYRLPFVEYEKYARELIDEYKALGKHHNELMEMYYIASKAQMTGDPRTMSLFKDGIAQIDIYESEMDPKNVCSLRARFRSSLSSVYDYNGFYQKAIEEIMSTISLAESCQDSLALLQAYRTAGAVIGNVEENMDYDLKSIYPDTNLLKATLYQTMELSKSLDVQNIYALACYNLAYYYYDHEQIDMAETYLDSSFAVHDIQSLALQRYYNYMLLSDIERSKSNKDLSYKYLMKGYKSAMEMNGLRQEFLARIDIADWMIWSGDFDQAEEYLLPMRGLLPENLELQKQYHEKTYLIAQGKSDYQTAFDEYQLYISYRDSITNQSTAQQLSVILSEYDRSEDEKKIEILKTDNLKGSLKNQRLLSVIVFLILSIGTLGTYLHFRYKTKLLQVENKNSDIEQRLFRAQMNPHFVFNTLGSIQSFLLNQKKSKEAAYFLAKFAKLMRQILMQSQKSYIPLQEELDTLQNYLLLQKMRFEDRFNYEIIIDESMDISDIKIPPMLLQPIVENAIEHGKIHTLTNGSVKVLFEQNANKLIAVVTDNGIGMDNSRDKNQFKDKDPVAIDIIKQRLEYLSKQFGDTVTMIYNKVPTGGTEVKFTLPKI